MREFVSFYFLIMGTAFVLVGIVNSIMGQTTNGLIIAGIGVIILQNVTYNPNP